MKTITLNIPDELYSDLKQAVVVRSLAGGSLYGLLDIFLAKLVSKVESKETTWDIEYKK